METFRIKIKLCNLSGKICYQQALRAVNDSAWESNLAAEKLYLV